MLRHLVLAGLAITFVACTSSTRPPAPQYAQPDCASKIGKLPPLAAQHKLTVLICDAKVENNVLRIRLLMGGRTGITSQLSERIAFRLEDAPNVYFHATNEKGHSVAISSLDQRDQSTPARMVNARPIPSDIISTQGTVDYCTRDILCMVPTSGWDSITLRLTDAWAARLLEPGDIVTDLSGIVVLNTQK
jgi:hypothetical protein